ncbi:LIC10774 family surface protein [Leptospira interrogans serovar Icterohaemorrhagiae]|uniref:LIC10774 family surface protein n=1 Tax=Leptospira interrogans TaxID=173 RepID=UPI003FA026FD
MKQIYGIIVAISLCLLAGCTNEGGNENYSNTLAAVSTKQLLDIVSNPNSKSSDLILEFPTLYVDSISGNDVTNTGTQSAPFRSITKAILVAKAKNISIIAVAPGTYDASIGETFPIVIPEEVNLYGDFNGKGLIGGSSSLYAGPPGTTPKTGITLISGNGPDVSGHNNVTLKLNNSSQVAGFKITNPKPFDNKAYSTTVLLYNTNSAKVKSNTIEGIFGGHGVNVSTYNSPDSGGNIISGNSILSNYNGIADSTMSASKVNKVEKNIIIQNNIGVKSNYVKLDLGQGSTGSVGENTFSCNHHQDIYVGTAASGQTQYALNNAWDHMPPTTFDNYSGYGIDIVNLNYETIVYYAGGSVASGACN